MAAPKAQRPQGLEAQLAELRAENDRLRAEVQRNRAGMLELEETRDELRVKHNRLARMTHHLQRAVSLAEAADVAKTRFLARMSHELRTPLHAVIATAGLLRTTALDPIQSEYMQTIESSGRALLSLIDDILDISSIEAGRVELCPAPFHADVLLRDLERCMRPIALDAGVTLVVDLVGADANRPLVGDQTRIRQVLTNLLDNGVVSAPGGTVKATLHVGLGERPGHRALRVEVDDDGPSLPASKRTRIFDLAADGDGHADAGASLGLAISKQLCDLMQGTLEVTDGPRGGNRLVFAVELPVAPAAPSGAPSRAPSGAPTSGHDSAVAASTPSPQRRALIVDDNRVNQRVAQRMLESLGFDVAVAGDGAEALEHFQREQPDGFALILMDCQMPNVDGFEATRRIRALEAEDTGRGHVPIVALTANAMASNERACMDAGMDAYQTKPMNLETLRALVARLPSLASR